MPPKSPNGSITATLKIFSSFWSFMYSQFHWHTKRWHVRPFVFCWCFATDYRVIPGRFFSPLNDLYAENGSTVARGSDAAKTICFFHTAGSLIGFKLNLSNNHAYVIFSACLRLCFCFSFRPSAVLFFDFVWLLSFSGSTLAPTLALSTCLIASSRISVIFSPHFSHSRMPS